MSRPIAAWGLGICTLAGIGAVAFGFGGTLTPVLLLGMGGFMVALGAVLLIARRDRSDPAPTIAAPDSSPPTTWAALGLVAMAVAVVAGPWAAWIGGGIVLVGVGGLVRETRAQRRALRAARREGAR